MASGAKHSMGGLLKIGDGAGPEAFTTIAEVSKIGLSGKKLDAIEVTNLSSADNYREFIGGLLDGGEVSLSLSYLPDSTGHAQLNTDQDARTLRNFEFHLPQLATPKKLSFAALITSITADVDMEKQITAEVTLKISGKPTWASI
jgi:predicted secreted protein